MPSVYSTLFLASLPFTFAFSAERRQVLPADFSSLPSCGQTCLLTAATSGNTGCSLTDFKCFATSASFKDSVTKCVLSSCSSADQIAVANWATKTSASLGTPLDLSGAAAAAGGAADKKDTPVQEKPTTDASTEAKPTHTKESTPSDNPTDKDSYTSSDRHPATPVAPTANDGSATTSKDKPVNAAPAGTIDQPTNNATLSTSTNPTTAGDNTVTYTNAANASKSNNPTEANNVTSASNQTESETSGSTLLTTANVLSLTMVTILVSSFL